VIETTVKMEKTKKTTRKIPKRNLLPAFEEPPAIASSGFYRTHKRPKTDQTQTVAGGSIVTSTASNTKQPKQPPNRSRVKRVFSGGTGIQMLMNMSPSPEKIATRQTAPKTKGGVPSTSKSFAGEYISAIWASTDLFSPYLNVV